MPSQPWWWCPIRNSDEAREVSRSKSQHQQTVGSFFIAWPVILCFALPPTPPSFLLIITIACRINGSRYSSCYDRVGMALHATPSLFIFHNHQVKRGSAFNCKQEVVALQARIIMCKLTRHDTIDTLARTTDVHTRTALTIPR